MQGVINAVTNSSREPVNEDEILAMLRTGDGQGHLVRALYGDCGIDALARLGAAAGMSLGEVRTAYLTARDKHCASNPELEAE